MLLPQGQDLDGFINENGGVSFDVGNPRSLHFYNLAVSRQIQKEASAFCFKANNIDILTEVANIDNVARGISQVVADCGPRPFGLPLLIKLWSDADETNLEMTLPLVEMMWRTDLERGILFIHVTQ